MLPSHVLRYVLTRSASNVVVNRWKRALSHAWCYPIPITGATRYHCDGGEGCPGDGEPAKYRGHIHTHYHTNHDVRQW